jgi:hyperosmotically inducible protein
MKLYKGLTAGLLTFLLLSSSQGFAQTSGNGNDTSNTNVVASTPEEDAMIVKSIKSKIAESKVLSPLKVDVASSNGVVTMTGNVDSDSEASLLIELAESIVGVSDVDASKLSIKESKTPFEDMATTAKIKGLFIKEKLFGDKDIAAINISVETNNGVVYLTGDVDNNAQIENAIKIIKQDVKGIKKVEYRVRKIEPVNNSSSQ